MSEPHGSPDPNAPLPGLKSGRHPIAPLPLRSMLFVPGNKGRWVEPARASGTDGIIFDLEDAVPPSEIDEARRVVRDAFERHGAEGPRLFARIAPGGTPGVDEDLDAVVVPGICGVMIPLVTKPEQVAAVADRLDELEARRGIPLGTTIIVPLVETAPAVRFCYEIAIASERVAYMGGGVSKSGDIARSLGYRWTPEGTETLTMRSWVLINVRAAGVAYPVSGVWGQVDDLVGLRQFAEQTRQLGFSGLMAIHPSQIPVINEIFTPTPEEIAEWREVITEMRAAQAHGVGAIRLRGELIDEAHVKTAELALDFAAKLGLLSEVTS